jgi:predicted ATPase
MRELPSGTVTFLFSDIESSTRLLRELGDHYAGVLAEHRRVLREAFTRYGGVEVDTQGDAFFVAFAKASDAVSSALAGQSALSGGLIRVRMGLHTGEPLVTKEGYVGLDVHKAARICAAGHGGQVLLSQATRDLIDGQVRDLGPHRLKDLQATERLYQLGDGDFPPLHSLNQTNLPAQPTPFLGRERELGDVLALLQADGTRLVTLAGPGGSGKTRLALQAATKLVDEYEHGVWWVPLGALTDPALVLVTAAQTLGARQELSDHIGDRRMLLLLDNFEQVVEAASDLAQLLVLCPHLGVLVTSREPLHLTGEQLFPLPPLVDQEGVSFFLARARAVQPDVHPDSDVAEICRRLDNLPLALELAAARVSVLSPTQILDRLEQRLPLLTGGARDAPARQRTLRATIEWSHDMLSDDERRLFRRLAVFAGGCMIDAAEDVCDAELDTLQSLVEKNLVRHERTRYVMLETIREYASEWLEDSGEAEQLRRRHAEFFTRQAEKAEPHLRGGREQPAWIERLERDYDNLRETMQWAIAADLKLALRFGGYLPVFQWVRGRFREGRIWLDAALALDTGRDPRLRAKALVAAAVLAETQGDIEAAIRFADESFALYSGLNDEVGVASALREQGIAFGGAGDFVRANTLLEECSRLAKRIGDVWTDAVARNNLGELALNEEDWTRAIELCSQSRAIRLGHGDRWGAALALSNIALAELHLRRLRDAARNFAQALAEGLEAGSTIVVNLCLEGFAAVAAANDMPTEAARLLGAAVAICEKTGIALRRFEQAVHDRTVSAMRASLGDEPYATEFELGRAMGLDGAVRYALSRVLRPTVAA